MLSGHKLPSLLFSGWLSWLLRVSAKFFTFSLFKLHSFLEKNFHLKQADLDYILLVINHFSEMLLVATIEY